ncbi:unnamed protein product [Adineta steineri]|uniref:Uncharacterized protein n=1 Tax=Adineta steineri TaxID=433720 RepID=A0A815X2E7_9BILA|nr:unnamed protein product [Adineta steineri]CAF1551519.1 unnamed protein product [Adineta steineri]
MKDIRELTNVDKKLRKILSKILAKQHVTIPERFREVKYSALRKEKKNFNRSNAIQSHQQDASTPLLANYPTPAPTYYQQHEQTVIPSQQETVMRAVTERDEEIHNVETDVVKVNESFKTTAQITSEQGVKLRKDH